MRKLLTDKQKNEFKRVYQSLIPSLRTVTVDSGNVDRFYDDNEKTYRELIEKVWNEYHGKDVSRKVTYGAYNMFLSQYGATNLDDLPKGSVGYVLGRRKSHIKHITGVLKARGMTFERQDPSKATFFIVGDILTKQDNLLNKDLTKPIVMDITLENEWNHTLSKIKYVKNVNERLFNSLFLQGTRKGLESLSKLLKFINAESLSNKTRTRLVLYYLNTMGSGYSYSDLKHKELIKTLRRLTLPQHQFLLEPKFSNSYSTANYCVEKKTSSSCKLIDKDYFGKLYITSSWSTSTSFAIPMEEDTYELFYEDIEENLKLTRSTKELIKPKWSHSHTVRKDYKSDTVSAETQVHLMGALLTTSIKYIDTGSNKQLLYISGYKPAISNWGRVSYNTYSTNDTISKKLSSIMEKELQNPIYDHEYVNNNEWSEEHIAPIKEHMKNHIRDFFTEIFGDSITRLFK